MINLLPPEIKQGIMFARRNTVLLQWIMISLAVIIGFLAITLLGQFYLSNTTNSYRAQVANTQADLKRQDLDAVQKRAEDISNNLKLILQVFSKEVLFSKLIRQIGSVMPSKSVLSNIEIGKLDGGLDLTASAQDYQTATQIQVNLQDPSNKLFDKVDIVSVNCGAVTKSTFPCSVALRASFAKNNPFLFSNSTAAKPWESNLHLKLSFILW